MSEYTEEDMQEDCKALDARLTAHLNCWRKEVLPNGQDELVDDAVYHHEVILAVLLKLFSKELGFTSLTRRIEKGKLGDWLEERLSMYYDHSLEGATDVFNQLHSTIESLHS